MLVFNARCLLTVIGIAMPVVANTQSTLHTNLLNRPRRCSEMLITNDNRRRNNVRHRSRRSRNC